MNGFEADVGVDGSDCRLDEIAALVLLGDDPAGASLTVERHGAAGPVDGRELAAGVLQNVPVIIDAEAANNQARFMASLGI